VDFDLYMEIVYFLHSGGGCYEVMNGDVQEKLLDALEHGRYVIQRDEAGNIIAFCDYWLVMLDDLEWIESGWSPSNVNSGSVVVVVDHVNKGGKKSLTATIRQIREQCPGAKGAAWFHKSTAPGMFRFYPSQRGK